MATEKLISAAEARKAILKVSPSFAYVIDNVPGVDAVEVVHGRWIDKREIPSYSNKNIPVVECSKCRCLFCDIINVHSFMYHYCPNCGVKMDLPQITEQTKNALEKMGEKAHGGGNG